MLVFYFSLAFSLLTFVHNLVRILSQFSPYLYVSHLHPDTPRGLFIIHSFLIQLCGITYKHPRAAQFIVFRSTNSPWHGCAQFCHRSPMDGYSLDCLFSPFYLFALQTVSNVFTSTCLVHVFLWVKSSGKDKWVDGYMHLINFNRFCQIAFQKTCNTSVLQAKYESTLSLYPYQLSMYLPF